MYPLTVQQICEITSGQPVNHADLAAIVDGCVIDSRDVEHGDAFFALSGTRQHGLRFAADAVRDGASCVVVDKSESAQCRSPHIVVPDCEFALAQLAHHNRHVGDALVIGITGSVGKTTTRSLIAQVLSTAYTGIQSPRNFNNYLGVPLSLLEIQEGDEFAVIEVAASAPGEVKELSRVVRPEFAVVTRIAPAHLRCFASLQAVADEKRELISSLPSDGVAFLNADDPLVAKMSGRTKARVVTFGESSIADIRVTDVACRDGALHLKVDGCQFRVPVCGRHMATGIAASIAVAQEIGVSNADISAGLQQFHAPPGRCNVSEIGQWTIIDDTYNSSPASVTAAIQTAEDYHAGRHRILVLGDMLDLGDQSSVLHYGIGASLAKSRIDHIAVIGDFAEDLVEGFLSSGGHPNRISVFTDLSMLLTMLDCLAGNQDLVLVKGSRGTAMERVIDHMRSAAADADDTIRRAA